MIRITIISENTKRKEFSTKSFEFEFKETAESFIDDMYKFYENERKIGERYVSLSGYVKGEKFTVQYYNTIKNYKIVL